MHSTLPTLLQRFAHPAISDANVIPWGSPVPSFGDPSTAKLATLGLNPSNREFMDVGGRELDGAARRFHTLNSLGIQKWNDAVSKHINLIVNSCRHYFSNNPYDAWFRQLDQIVSGANVSYYGSQPSACHLDLIPYATLCKWMNLTRDQRNALLEVTGDTLGHVLNESPIRVLVLNGRSVVDQFQALAGTTLDSKEMPSWSLRRRGIPSISGTAYRGIVRQVAGVRFKRDLLVLGFNHNIQSSFGVTNEVRAAIGDWIANAAKEAI